MRRAEGPSAGLGDVVSLPTGEIQRHDSRAAAARRFCRKTSAAGESLLFGRVVTPMTPAVARNDTGSMTTLPSDASWRATWAGNTPR